MNTGDLTKIKPVGLGEEYCKSHEDMFIKEFIRTDPKKWGYTLLFIGLAHFIIYQLFLAYYG